MALHLPSVVFSIVDSSRLNTGGDGEVSLESAIACFLPSHTSMGRQMAIVGHLSAACEFVHTHFDVRKARPFDSNGASCSNTLASNSESGANQAFLAGNWQQHYAESQFYRYAYAQVNTYRFVLAVANAESTVFSFSSESLSAWIIKILEFAAVCSGQLNTLLTYRETESDAEQLSEFDESLRMTRSMDSADSVTSSLDRERWAKHKSKLERVFCLPVALLERAVIDGDLVAHLATLFTALPSFSMMTSSSTREATRRRLIDAAIESAGEFLTALRDGNHTTCSDSDVHSPIIGGCVMSGTRGCCKLVTTSLPERLTCTLVQIAAAEPTNCKIDIGSTNLQSQLAARAYEVHVNTSDMRPEHRLSVRADCLVDIIGDVLRRELQPSALLELRRAGRGVGVQPAPDGWFILLLVKRASLDDVVARVRHLLDENTFCNVMTRIDTQLREVSQAFDDNGQSQVTRRVTAPDMTSSDLHASFAMGASVLSFTVERSVAARRRPSLTLASASSTVENPDMRDAQRAILELTENIIQSLNAPRPDTDTLDHVDSDGEGDSYVDDDVERERVKCSVLVTGNQLVAVTCSEHGEFEVCATSRTNADATGCSPYYNILGDSYKRVLEFLDRVDHVAAK